MKSLIVLTLAASLLAAGAAQAADPAIAAPIHQFEAAFNKGDMKAAKATHIAAPTIVDEVAPFYWSGPTAFDAWLAASTKADTAGGVTDDHIVVKAPSREVVEGDTAYVISPSIYTYKEKGAPMRETGQMTFVMAKTKAGWKIANWTWTSPEAKPAK